MHGDRLSIVLAQTHGMAALCFAAFLERPGVAVEQPKP